MAGWPTSTVFRGEDQVRRISMLLLAAGLGLGAIARAGEREFGAVVSLTYGFKPEFYKSEGDGRYLVGALKGEMTQENSWGVSVTESVESVEHPEKVTAAADPLVRFSLLKNPLADFGLRLSLSLELSPGLSLASRDRHFYGYLRPAAGVSTTWGSAVVGIGASVARRFYRYTLDKNGVPTQVYSKNGFIFASYDLGAGFSASANLGYIETVSYAGPVHDSYSNSLGLAYAATEALSLETGISSSDSQRSPNGDDNNEFTLYKQNKTEMYVSAAYAL